MIDSEVLKTVGIVGGSIVGLFTFTTAVLEYVRQGRQTRAQQFIEMERRFRENQDFAEIIELLETDDPRLAQMPVIERRGFLAFFEEVALMVNSRLLRPQVAHYMFAYYLDLCMKSENLWMGIKRDDTFWTLLHDFHRQLQSMTRDFQFDRRMFRF